jgi:large subunit ribosomal protein L25
VQTLIATPRKDMKKSVKRQLRESGKIPAVVYGKTVDNTAIHVEEKDFSKMLKEHGSNTLVKLMWGEGNSTVMIGEIQTNPLKNEILHIDFNQVNMNKKVTTEIPVEWTGEAAGVKEGGVLQTQYRTIEVTCLPNDIPEQFTADISSLGIGDSFTVGDLNIAENIDVQIPADAVIVSVLAPRLEETEPEEDQDDYKEPEIVDAVDGPGIDEAK